MPKFHDMQRRWNRKDAAEEQEQIQLYERLHPMAKEAIEMVLQLPLDHASPYKSPILVDIRMRGDVLGQSPPSVDVRFWLEQGGHGWQVEHVFRGDEVGMEPRGVFIYVVNQMLRDLSTNVMFESLGLPKPRRRE